MMFPSLLSPSIRCIARNVVTRNLSFTKDLSLSNFVIRHPSPSDAQEILDCQRLNLPERYSIENLQRLLYIYERCCFVAEYMDQYKGKVFAGYGLATSINNHGHLLSIVVNPEYRKCGLASEMMCRIHDAVVQELKVDSINLYVRATNKPAVELYQKKFGYELDSIYYAHYADGEDALILKKTLLPKEK